MLDTIPPGTLDETPDETHNEDDEEYGDDQVGLEVENLQMQLEKLRQSTTDAEREVEVVEDLVSPKVLENTLANLKEGSVHKLRDKIHNMETKIMQKDLLINHLTKDLEEVKTKYKKEVDNNIQLGLRLTKI